MLHAATYGLNPGACVLLLLLHSFSNFPWSTASAQSTATLQGRVVDPADAVVAGANITVTSEATGVERFVRTDGEGNYQVAALPVGAYRIEVHVTGFRRQIVENVIVEVGRTIVRDFSLFIGDISDEVTVTAGAQLVERTTVSVGHVVDQRMVQEIPLNGRYFLDLGLLVPGTVTPPQNGYGAIPVRGSGSFAINTAGNREETVNYMINGITLNNLWFNSIAFQPSISSVQEFKVDNSTFSAEYGQNSGAVVNIATRSGGNEFHGELFESLRNDTLDARNFFDFTSSKPPPFKRNQFGGHLGGPIVRKKTFFFASYEGLRHRQRLTLNSLVLSDAERASATDPVIVKLIELIPRANLVDSSGMSRLISAATAPVNIDHWTLDVSHNLSDKDRLHGYYAVQRRDFIEPGRQGNTIPGFGNTHHSLRQIFTLNEIHTFGTSLVSEARFGFNRIFGMDAPNAQFNPAAFGILGGISEPIGLPQIDVAGGNLNFGGPALFPSGRGDTIFAAADTVSLLAGRHSLKLGGEFRQFLNNNIRRGTGAFTFPTVAAFLADTANSFSVTLGDQSSSIAQGAVGFFAQDNFKLRPELTLDLGLRYEWNMTPAERYNRFIVFDPDKASLVRVGKQIGEIYHENNKNLQPRLGFAWDLFGHGKTVLRAAYAILVDQPLTSVASGRSANPPLAMPLTFTGPIRLDNAVNLARAAGLAPQTVDHDFNNPYIQSWNLNVQRQLTPDLAMMVGYFGSKGTHLIIRCNLNQPVNGVRPFPVLSRSSPILPGTPLGNITEVESSGNSNYNALWVTANRRLARGFQFNTSYTWSKSFDYNSLSLQGVVVQNSYDLRGDRGLSDFDARHRFVASAIYDLPFRGNLFVEGWQLAAIVQAQSGNPVNIVTSNSTVNGVPNTLRPDVTGPITIIGDVDRWFGTSVFTPVAGFGSLRRNVVIGPTFNNTDFSVSKNIRLGRRIRTQFRADFFDLLNHANFGQPGNVVGTPAFGRITSTRFPTGESGSSRQVQFTLKLFLDWMT
ncbi:MAG TPA: carboxypeptidase regulatory-like domain-containing protein [Terriglobia bacterium]|nr:carboxypeptidase regulatory-like domain-containing protein [Terriglobia bacterium]